MLTGAVLLLVVATGASAATPPAMPALPATSLVLGVSSAGLQKEVALQCEPTGGTHPQAAEACAALNFAGGDIDQLPPRPNRMCPHLVRPVTATATGVYRNQSLSYRRTFNNSCEMDRATHPMFDF